MTPSINKEFKWKHPDPGQLAFVFSDCDDSQKIVVQQAITDALDLASDAGQALSYDPMRPHWHRMFDKIFADKTVSPRRYLSPDWASSKYKRVGNGNSLPNEIIFHCSEAWGRYLSQINTNPVNGGTKTQCGVDTEAITIRIRSGDIPPANDPDNDPGTGAFRSGTHILLCDRFFAHPAMSALEPILEDNHISRWLDSHGSIMLHELMHASDSRIRDGGYGYSGCLAVARGQGPRDSSILPEFNAETWALFAISVSDWPRPNERRGRMRDWEWTDGYAVRRGLDSGYFKRDLLGLDTACPACNATIGADGESRRERLGVLAAPVGSP
ncbi:hypothetical protein V8F33_004029 [Rhypophila sp. PSN 637]